MQSLLIKHISLLEESAEGAFTFVVVKCGAGAPRHNHEMDVLLHERAMGAIGFPDIPFDPIAHNGTTHFARHRHPDLPPLTCLPDRVTDERFTDGFDAMLIGVQELRFPDYSFATWKMLLARHQRLIFS